MELLKSLYCIHSKSGKEKRIRRFIKRWVLNNVPDAIIEQDDFGNVYFTRGVSDTYPVVVAHLDQVQSNHSKDFEAIHAGNIIFGYSFKCRSQQGLGADDKNGIWVGLNCLKDFDVIKVAFFVQEEVGCIGSEHANMDFFKDARFVLQCDRRGAHDLITTAGWTELCSKEFVQAINPDAFGYKEEEGMLTDVLTLKERGLNVSCVNISCGYYEPHTDYEHTCVSDLLTCLSFVVNIIKNCKDVYPHEYSYKSYYDSYYYNNEKSENAATWEESVFREMYWDAMKEAILSYPKASFDDIFWYLKEVHKGTHFWEDWTRSLYDDVFANICKETLDKIKEEKGTEVVADI